MKGAFQVVSVCAIESGADGRECRCNVEYDACLFVGERVLTDWFLAESIVPDEAYADVVLVDGEAEVEQLELAIVAVEEVSSGVVFSCAAGILS
jgi:hypothetical protein